MLSRIALAPVIVAGMVAFASLDAHAQSRTLSPAQAYGETLNVMAALPQPAGFKFDATVSIKGAGIKVNHDKESAALQIGIGRGFTGALTWPAEFRAAGATATIVSEGVTYKVRSPLFKPTWRTASIWSRYGFRGQTDATPAPATPEPVAIGPAGENSEGGAVIGRIQSLSPGGYKIEDGGAETCASSKNTRHLHFTPVGDSKTHPLTDVIIDEETKRVCSMRFRVAAQRSAITLTGFVRVDYGEHNGFWLVSGGGGDYVLRFFGMGFKTAAMSFDYTNYVMENP